MLKRPRLSLSESIFIGLGLGLAAGLVFGELTSTLQVVADVYIRLMQMTVLPYLVLALITGFGQLDATHTGKLVRRVAVLLLVTWGATSAVIAALPATFPDMKTASFFSNALIAPPEPFSIADTYFTSNPFNSLANSIVPAVVLFSALLGVGLMRTPGRERLLEPLKVANTAIAHVTNGIARVTPVGVFALVAVTSGSMRLSTLESLEVYFLTFVGASLVMGFCALPLMAAAVTPFRYIEVVSVARGALATAFVANNAFIVLPILVVHTRELLAKHGLLNADSDGAAEILTPILFNFPNAGRLLTLSFVPFAAWLAGSPLSAVDLPLLFAVGIPTYFAKAQVALPFLLDLFKVPHDVFDLYIPTTIITGKFDALVTAMNLLVFSLIGAAAASGGLRIERRRLVRAGLATLAATLVMLVGVRVVLAWTVDTTYRRDQALMDMHGDGPAILVTDLASARRAPRPAGVPVLTAARARGRLRIGYAPANVPFSFVNNRNELVGFDVDLARSLAQSLQLEAEFVPIEWAELPAMLAAGAIDVMPGMWVRPYWFGRLALTEPYFTGTIGVVVRDERRREFAEAEPLRRRSGLRVAVPLDSSQLAASMQRYFSPDTEFVRFDSPADYFVRDRPDIDAFLMPAEAGAAATLLHPEFSVVVPQPSPVRLPYAFGVALDADDVLTATKEWIVYATSEGTIQRAYDYWILGQGTADAEPRWSVVHNLLGWPRPGR